MKQAKSKNRNTWTGFILILMMAALMACSPGADAVDPPAAEEVQQLPPEPTTPAKTELESASPDPGGPQELTALCQQALAGSLCNNPYFPPIEGLTLVYQVTTPGGDQHTQTRQIGPLQSGSQDAVVGPVDSYEIRLSGPNVPPEIEYLCTPDGMVVNEGQLVSSAFEALAQAQDEVEIISTSYEGVTYPQEIFPGDTWEATFSILMRAKGSDEDIHLITRYLHTFTGYESVDVPAGSFEARRVDVDAEMKMGIYPADTDGMPPSMLDDDGFFSMMSVPISMTLWNVECLGLVQSESEALEQKTVIQLQEYILPKK